MKELKNISLKLEELINDYNFFKKELENISVTPFGGLHSEYTTEQVISNLDSLEKEILYNLKSIFRIINKTEYIDEDFHFSDCSKNVYLKLLKNRFKKYVDENGSSITNLFDFLSNEKENIGRENIIEYEKINIDYSDFFDKIFDFRVAARQKIELLSGFISRIENSTNDFYLNDNGLLVEISKSEKIVESICKKIEEHEKLNDGFKSIEEAMYDDDYNHEEYLITKREIEILEEEIRELLDKLYYQSQKDEYFYADCTFKIFETNYKKDLENFKERYPDADDISFIDLGT